jgi:tRNA dimethylallyltransferase
VARDLARLGRSALRAELAAADPASAARIHPNDEYRLTRALEIVRASGGRLADFAAGTGPRAGYDFMVASVERPRDELFARIDRRVDAMFAAGLEGELGALLAAGCGAACPGMKAIGYREFLDAPPGATAAETAERIKLDTRRYARRQETFFRGLPGLRRIGPDPEALLALVLELLAR